MSLDLPVGWIFYGLLSVSTLEVAGSLAFPGLWFPEDLGSDSKGLSELQKRLCCIDADCC